MKTSNEDFLDKISKKALEKASSVDMDEPKLVKPEELQKKVAYYPTIREKLIIPKLKYKQVSPKSYPVAQETIELV